MRLKSEYYSIFNKLNRVAIKRNAHRILLLTYSFSLGITMFSTNLKQEMRNRIWLICVGVLNVP